MAFLIGGANSAADTGYDIDNSLRLADDAYLDRTRSSQSNTTGTFSAWIKTAAQNNIRLAGGHTDVNNRSYFYFPTSGGSGGLFSRTSGSLDLDFNTNALYRDPSAWYHLVIAFDTTQATESNRVKWYVNGEQVTSFSASTYPSQDASIPILNQAAQTIGAAHGASAVSEWSDGYIAEVYYVDGTAYAASDFGETDEDSGIWKPKDAKDDLTFGTNGFYLEFKETGTDQDASGIGADTSGEDNHLAVTSLAATDQTTDTPTNNFCTFNPLTATGGTYSEGNTIITTGSDASRNERGTFGMDSGKWYWEYKLAGSSINNIYLGIGTTDTSVGAEQTGTYTYYSADSTGRIYTGGSIVDSPTEFAVDDIVSIAYNADDNQVLFYLNGVLEYTTSSVTDVTYNPFARIYYTTSEVQANFGNPSFAISSGNADANGYGNFEYAVPSGYYALCTKNLAEFG